MTYVLYCLPKDPSGQLHPDQTPKYRLDAEAKRCMVLRIPEDVYKSQGQNPRDL